MCHAQRKSQERKDRINSDAVRTEFSHRTPALCISGEYRLRSEDRSGAGDRRAMHGAGLCSVTFWQHCVALRVSCTGVACSVVKPNNIILSLDTDVARTLARLYATSPSA